MTKTYQITSKAGQDMGTWTGETSVHALAAMHADAGYTVKVENGELVFESDEDATLCGGTDDWTITEASRFATIEEAQASLRSCGEDWEAITLEERGSWIYNEDGEKVGKRVPSFQSSCSSCGSHIATGTGFCVGCQHAIDTHGATRTDAYAVECNCSTHLLVRAKDSGEVFAVTADGRMWCGPLDCREYQDQGTNQIRTDIVLADWNYDDRVEDEDYDPDWQDQFRVLLAQ